jgi:bacterioferritin-associated ferredoxin
MYICTCNAITERQIEGAVELGCTSVAQLGRDLGLGSCCGKCVPEARKLLRHYGASNEPELRYAAGDD